MRSHITVNPLLRSCLAVVMGPMAMTLLAACSSSSNNTAADAGTADTGTVTDSGVACAIDPPTGFTTVLAPSNDGYPGIDTTMVKDENDDPMIAYAWVGAATGSRVYFTRWDRCVGAFTSPVVVDDAIGDIGVGQPSRRIALAYDPTAKKLAIAYELNGSLAAGENNSNQVYIQTSADKGATWAGKNHISDQKPGDGEQCSAPAIALANGKIQVAYEQLNRACCRDSDPNCGGCSSVWYLEGDGTTFTRTQVKDTGGPVQPGPQVLSMAVDSAGKPALAFIDQPATAYNRQIIFWRPDSVTSLVVGSSNNIQNDDPSLALTFDGLKPRIAATLGSDEAATYDIQFFASDNGNTWFAPVKLPRDGSQYTAWYQAISIDSKGGAAVSAYINGGGGDNKCGDPRIIRSSDLATWTACGADVSKTYSSLVGEYVQSYFTKADKLSLAFHGSLGGDGDGKGVVFWRDQ